MLKVKFIICCIMLIGVLATNTYGATAVFMSDFEAGAGLPGWTEWVQAGSSNIAAVAENPILYDNLVTSNDYVASIGGSPEFVGGIYTIVSVPTNTPLQIDGAWRTQASPPASPYGEVIVYEYDGSNAPVDGQPVLQDVIYRNDLTASPSGWSGIIFDTADALQNPSAGVLGTGSLSGEVVVLLKGQGVEFDDMVVTPEPVTAVLLIIGGLGLLRRRRIA